MSPKSYTDHVLPGTMMDVDQLIISGVELLAVEMTNWSQAAAPHISENVQTFSK